MRPLLVPTLVAAAFALTACTPAASPVGQSPIPTVSATSIAPSTTPSVTAAPETTATPAPTAEAPAAPPAEASDAPTEGTTVAATCDTVLTDAEYAGLAEDGLVLNPDIFVLDDQMQSILDGGGLGCYWTRSSGDVRVWYAQGARPADAWDAQKQALIGVGWTEIGEPVPGAIQAPTDNDDDYIPVLAFRDGVVHYASYADLLGSVTALQG